MARTQLSLPIDGAKLRRMRELRGWEQGELTDLTERVGHRVDRTRISLIENGRARPTAKQLRVLAEVFGVAPEELLFEDAS